MIKEDVLEAVREFFNSSKLIKKLNHTFMVLIAKVEGATKLGDFRPIACCNFLYKIITHLMCDQMMDVMQELISPNQMAFIKGHSILENPLLVHELVRDFNKQRVIKLKLDLTNCGWTW